MAQDIIGAGIGFLIIAAAAIGWWVGRVTGAAEARTGVDIAPVLKRPAKRALKTAVITDKKAWKIEQDENQRDRL